MNIITRASVKERIHVEQIIRSQPHMHNSGLVDIVTIPVRKCLGLSMDVYKPVGEVKEPLPIILDIHGGGLIAGRKEQNRNLGIQLARRGYIVFIPDYRLVPETDIFGQISDILDALAVIEAKAAEFGGNIEKLFVTADSAGAFLASMAVASLHHPAEMQPVIRRLERYIPQKVQALRVTAMGFQSGMFYLYKGQVGLLADNYMQKGWRKEKYASNIRPEYYCKLLPPCFLCSGKGDFLKGQTKRYVKLLKTNHQYHQFVFCNVKEADHAFAALHPETAWGQMANDEMLAFFYRCARYDKEKSWHTKKLSTL